MDEPRLALTDEDDWDERTRGILDATGRLNIFRALANHPALLRRWLTFGGHVLSANSLPDRERELVILRTGWRCGSEYEFGQHTVIGARAGLTDDEISRLTQEGVTGWSDADATLVRATDQLVADHALDDATWELLASTWSTHQLIDLVFTVGQYVLVSTALNTFRVPLDDGTPGWPDAGAGDVRG